MARLGDRVSLRVAALLMRKTGWMGELYCTAVSVIQTVFSKAGHLWRKGYTDCLGGGEVQVQHVLGMFEACDNLGYCWTDSNRDHDQFCPLQHPLISSSPKETPLRVITTGPMHSSHRLCSVPHTCVGLVADALHLIYTLPEQLIIIVHGQALSGSGSSEEKWWEI